MPKKRALLCAINDYGDPRNNLPSCLADAAAFKEVLKANFGFADAEIRELYDSAATMSGVRGGLGWLFDAPGPDDRLVFYYSGHGYTRLENGTLEEMLVLRGDGGGLDFFKDDELSSRTRHLPPGCLTVISDSCYSGGMEKGLLSPLDGFELVRSKVYVPSVEEQTEKALALERGGVKKFKPFGAAATPHVDRLAQILALDPASAVTLVDLVGKPKDDPNQTQMNGLLVAACKEDETAAASSSRTNGLSAFTYGLLGVLANPEIEGPQVGYGSSSAEIHQAVTAKLIREGFRQSPVLKEPVEPAGLGARSFINLGSVTTTPTSTPTSPTPVPTTPAGGSWMNQLLQNLQGMFNKEPATQAPTKGAQVDSTADKGWADLIPMIPRIVNLGMDVYQTVTKEGLLPPDKAVAPAGATQAEQEKWIEFIPQIIDLGVQVYQSLNKGDLLPPEKDVSIPGDATLQEPEKWIELIPQFVNLGLEVYNSLKSKGFVVLDKSANLPEDTTQQEAQKWLSLVPIAISVGLEVYNALKSKDLILDVDEAAKGAVGAPDGNGATKAAEGTAADALVEALNKAGYNISPTPVS
jgi:hypothetical protein